MAARRSLVPKGPHPAPPSEGTGLLNRHVMFCPQVQSPASHPPSVPHLLRRNPPRLPVRSLWLERRSEGSGWVLVPKLGCMAQISPRVHASQVSSNWSPLLTSKEPPKSDHRTGGQ